MGGPTDWVPPADDVPEEDGEPAEGIAPAEDGVPFVGGVPAVDGTLEPLPQEATAKVATRTAGRTSVCRMCFIRNVFLR